MLSLFILGADYAGTAIVADGSTARGRLTNSAVPGQPISSTGGVDLATTATARLSFNDRRLSFSFGYSPVLTLPDLQNGPDLQVFQSADAGMTWHNRRVSIFVGDSASFGTFNSGYNFQPGAQSPDAMTAPSGPGQGAPAANLALAPQPQTIHYVSNRTNASVAVKANRRTSVSVSSYYTLSRGLGTTSEAAIPPERGIEGDTAVSYALTPRDYSRTALAGEDIVLTGAPCLTAAGLPEPNVTCRPETQSLTLGESYSHMFDAATSISIGGGPEFARTRTDTGVPYTTSWYPTALASLAHKYARRGLASLSVNVLLVATPDYRTGVLSERAQGDVALVDVLDAVVAITFDAGGGQTLPLNAPTAATIVRGGVEANFRLDRQNRLLLTAGANTQWQTQNPFGSFFSTYGYFAVTAATPALRF